MSERITLSYSINLNDLGSETHRLYEAALAKIEALSMEPIAIEDVLESKVYEYIDKLRQDMLEIDLCLSDLGTIILAYNQHRNLPAAEKARAPETSQDELGEKIKDFTDKILPS